MVIAILGILALGIFQLTSTNKVKVQETESVSQKMISLLREARALAVTGETVETTGAPQVPQGGFGFMFKADERQGFVFADVNDDGVWNTVDDGEALSQFAPFFEYIEVETIATDISGDTPITTTNTISHSVSNPQNIWIIFAANSLDVTFGAEGGGVDATDTKSLEIKIGIPGLKEYSVDVNKVSRFLELDLVSS